MSGMEKKVEFSHRSVLLDECIEGLAIRPDGVYVDGTAGGGGTVQTAQIPRHMLFSFGQSDALSLLLQHIPKLLTRDFHSLCHRGLFIRKSFHIRPNFGK